MSRTALTPQIFAPGGLTPTTVTPDASGVSFRNTKRAVLQVTNGAGSSITVTPVIGGQVEGVSVTSPAITLAAGATAFYGPFDTDYNQPGLHDTAYVNFSAITTVTVALLEMPLKADL